MRVLYAVLVLCTCALIGAAIAVSRHIRRQRHEARSQHEQHEEPL